MCERCGAGCKAVVIDGISYLKHYCFSPLPDPSKPPGFDWVVEQPAGQEYQ